MILCFYSIHPLQEKSDSFNFAREGIFEKPDKKFEADEAEEEEELAGGGGLRAVAAAFSQMTASARAESTRQVRCPQIAQTQFGTKQTARRRAHF